MRTLILFSVSLVLTLVLPGSLYGVFIDDLRCMPVLIEIPLPNHSATTYGTGVYLESSSGLYLVTAAHCIFDMSSTNKAELIGPNAVLSSLVMGTNTNSRCVLSVNLDKLQEFGLVKRHPIHDIAVIKLADCDPIPHSTASRLTYNSYFVSFMTTETGLVGWATNSICKTFNNVCEGSDSYLLGYPVALLSAQSGEIDFSAPLIRKGIISQKNQRTKKLIIDSAVYGGNSGGPVLMVENTSLTQTKFLLVGIITQYVPTITQVNVSLAVTNTALVNSGYGVAEPIDYALELMQ